MLVVELMVLAAMVDRVEVAVALVATAVDMVVLEELVAITLIFLI